MLKQAADDGEIQLKYLDESGFCLWSPVSYSYNPVGEQKRMEQTKPVYGWRISILGLWQENVGFEYGLAKCSNITSGSWPLLVKILNRELNLMGDVKKVI